MTGSYTATPGNGSPMDSSGEFSVRVMMIASSVEPYASLTVQPKRSAKAGMSLAAASLPKATRRVVSASSGRGGVSRM